jgi:predicted Zn-dependent protease
MNKQTKSLRLVLGGTLLAMAGLVVTVPFNMGGCSAPNLSQINVNQLGQGINKAVKAGAMDARNERAIGESVSLALTNQYGVVSDPKLTQYVVLVGQTIASRTGRADQPWVFGVLDTDTVNAYSGPGGYVWITRGAIFQMQDESELAGVLAHECGHVVKHHGLDAAKQAGFADAFVTAASSPSAPAQFNGATDKLVDVLVKQGFTQPQEFEADALSAKFTAAAGYDPDGFLHFLQRIRQKQKEGAPNLFSTHPGIDDRIKRLQDQISSAGTGGHGATLRDRFLTYTGKAPITDATDQIHGTASALRLSLKE